MKKTNNLSLTMPTKTSILIAKCYAIFSFIEQTCNPLPDNLCVIRHSRTIHVFDDLMLYFFQSSVFVQWRFCNKKFQLNIIPRNISITFNMRSRSRKNKRIFSIVKGVLSSHGTKILFI